MTRALDAIYVRSQIDLLRSQHPEIWEDEQSALDALEGETGFNELLERTIRQMLMAEAIVIGTAAELSLMKARRERYEHRIEQLRAFAMKIMQHADVRKVVLPIRTLSISNGQPRVIVTDEAALPDYCMRIKREPDKLIIKDRLQRGDNILGATLSNAEPVLNVRK